LERLHDLGRGMVVLGLPQAAAQPLAPPVQVYVGSHLS